LFLRIEDKGYTEPFWSSYGPELIDISISNWCDFGCDFCYKKSNIFGIHMSIENYEIILKQAAQMNVSQIALGGGNPNQHPKFIEVLRLTREEFDIVPSYTTNGRGLTEDKLIASKLYCGAVAVSAYSPYDDMQNALLSLAKHQIKTNIHFLLSADSVETAISWLESPPKFLDQINAIIFLNYKPVGYYHSETRLAKIHPEIERFFSLINQNHKFKIGFDSCSISGIAKFLNVNPVSIENCEAGRFSMYISEDMKMYPCSFMVDKLEGIEIQESNIQDSWRLGKSLQDIRTKIGNNSCGKCESINICSGGCPVFPEINFCN
jgi:radical SAM protein with 4Fe4S-binding SPASM domain